MYNMVHVFPHVRSFTCWEPQFDLVSRFFKLFNRIGGTSATCACKTINTLYTKHFTLRIHLNYTDYNVHFLDKMIAQVHFNGDFKKRKK